MPTQPNLDLVLFVIVALTTAIGGSLWSIATMPALH